MLFIDATNYTNIYFLSNEMLIRNPSYDLFYYFLPICFHSYEN